MRKGIWGLLGAVTGAAGTLAVTANINGKINSEQAKKTEKFRAYYNVLNQWLMLKQEGKTIGTYFQNIGYHTIAIYGMGELGNRLLKELEESGITVKYCMNSNAPTLDADMRMVEKEDLNTVDAVIVTALFAFDEIEEELTGRCSCPVISLEEVVFGL